MPELSGFKPEGWARIRSVRVARVAGRQSGVISSAQLVQCGVSGTVISRWVDEGRLHPVHPRVYAVGHRALDIRGRVVAALLYAGPGAALSHQTAAWWWDLIGAEPKRIHISAPGDHSSLRDVRIHHPRRIERVEHRGLAVTTVARTLLDIAATMHFDELRRAVAEADYRRLLDPLEVSRVLGRGRRGSRAVRAALAAHMPQLARTLSPLEVQFLLLCERHGLPLPEVNVKVAGYRVDCLWRDAKVIVELDGNAGHAYEAAVERDRRRDLTLRVAGFVVHRYTRQQVTREQDQVVADLAAALFRR